MSRPLFGGRQDIERWYLSHEEVWRLLAYRARFPQLVDEADEERRAFAEDSFSRLE